MYKPITHNKLFTKVSALLLTLSLTLSCLAQNQAGAQTPQTYWVTVTQVKPGMMDEYQEFLKTQTLAAFKKSGGKQWQTWAVETFGEGGEIWTFRPVESLRQFDEPNFLTKALGAAGARVWNARRAQMIVGSRSFLISYSSALSIPGKGEPKIGINIKVSVTPGRLPEYLKWVKENGLAAVSKTNAKALYVGVVSLGGNPNEVDISVQFNNFEDLERFPQAYGKALADLKLQANPAAGVVAHTEFAVYRFVPELSLSQPMTQQAGNK